MAILQTPFLSIGARKTLGKSITVYRARGLDIARQRVVPANPRTAAQLAVRALFTRCANLVRAFCEAYKTAWAEVAAGAGKHETYFSCALRNIRKTLGMGTVGTNLFICDAVILNVGQTVISAHLKKQTETGTISDAVEPDLKAGNMVKARIHKAAGGSAEYTLIYAAGGWAGNLTENALEGDWVEITLATNTLPTTTIGAKFAA